MTQVIYLPKIFKIHWKELELSSGHRPTDGRTDGRTDGQTDRRTDEQGESSIPPLNFVSGGITMVTLTMLDDESQLDIGMFTPNMKQRLWN